MKRIYIIILLLLSFGVTLKGQDFSIKSRKAIKYYKKATNYYYQRNDDNAIIELGNALEKEPDFIEAYLLLGDIYTDKRKYDKAIDSYQSAIKIDSAFFPNAYYLCAKLYLRQGAYENAKNYLDRFLKFRTTSRIILEKAKHDLAIANFGVEQVSNPVPFDPIYLPGNVNDSNSQFINAVTASDSTLIYTLRKPTKRNDRGEIISNIEYLSVAELSPQDSLWHPTESLENIFGFSTLTGASSISPDGNEMYLTACGMSNSFGSCDIYYTKRNEDGSWAIPRNMGQNINSSSWDSQPSISADGNTLYFASRRRGGKGGVDIWMSKRKNGRWTKAVNLGKTINTRLDEATPFIHFDDKTLYFASEGHLGMGDKDIFISKKDEKGNWSEPINLGYPINTQYEEKALVVSASGKKAYYSSDRKLDSLALSYNIYSFELYKDIRPKEVSYLKGIVVDAETNAPVKAKIKVYNLSDDELVGDYENIHDGSFLAVLPGKSRYAVDVDAKGYLFWSEHFFMDTISTALKPYTKIIELEKIKEGKRFILRNIYFATNEYELLSSSMFELEQLVSFLQDNPTVKIIIRGHTDNVGNKDYNLKLSLKRAKSVYDYLIKSNIDFRRLKYIGLGDKEPIVTNDNEVNRSKNRRTEIEIMK
ncbi:MAG: OmpA family protein [Hyphomicrobiales bacterium]